MPPSVVAQDTAQFQGGGWPGFTDPLGRDGLPPAFLPCALPPPPEPQRRPSLAPLPESLGFSACEGWWDQAWPRWKPRVLPGPALSAPSKPL